jgi:hypothetical protein
MLVALAFLRLIELPRHSFLKSPVHSVRDSKPPNAHLETLTHRPPRRSRVLAMLRLGLNSLEFSELLGVFT